MNGDVLTEVRFWSQVIGDAKRTVLCPPDLESRCKGYVDARGLAGLITVKASRACPPNQILVIDEQAIEADMREFLARPIRIRFDPEEWRP